MFTRKYLLCETLCHSVVNPPNNFKTMNNEINTLNRQKGAILLLDNYDSFTYNLLHVVKEQGVTDIEVFRNDEITLDEVERFDKIILSPGPGIPEEAGLLLPIIRKYAAEVAKKTFNPRLGIEGGISILGTTGIVEPMSEKALTDTIYLEMKMLKENGTDWCYVVPGNYGMDFLRKKLHVDTALLVKCSNYVGETIEDAKLLGMKGILLIGHIGKFIKLAAGVMNTHSRQADCRMEVLGVHAAMNGADAAVVREIMDCINTTEAMEILRREKLIEPVMESVMKRIEFFLKNRAGEELEIGVILFSTEDGILGKSENADELLKKIQENR